MANREQFTRAVVKGKAAWLPAAILAALLLPAVAGAQSAASSCSGAPAPASCRAVSGDRASGWYTQHRSEVMARNGVVATSQPLAAQAGLEILRRGGNAIDAAVATAAVLSVVEPMNVGPAGDLFAIVYIAREKKLYAINASGTAPSGLTPERLASLGYNRDPTNWGPGSGMPLGGILGVTVPGSVWGWEALLKRFGTRTFRETLEPAVNYAEQGFAVTERIAHGWVLPKALGPAPADPRGCCTQLDPISVATWYVNGSPPRPGTIVRNPGLAKTFRALQRGGAAAFYQGEIARAMVARSTELGGTMTLADLAGYKGQWVEPARSTFRGYDIFTLPPPAQTWAAGEMLHILEACVPQWAPGQSLSTLGPADPRYWHFLVEAKKLAYADLYTFNADPDFATIPLERLLSPEHASSLCSKADPAHASAPAATGNADGHGDTIVLTTADRWGNMVAMVNSLYDSFGSGITVPGYGLALHNRGSLFSLQPGSPNLIAPGKRPFNTLSAGFVMQQGQPVMAVTLMGGDMQAQGIAQVLVNVLDLGANLQSASDMARFRHAQVSNRLGLESRLDSLVGSELRAMGHNVRTVHGDLVGGYQAIMFVPDSTVPASSDGASLRGYYRAGSDHRKDGAAVGW